MKKLLLLFTLIIFQVSYGQIVTIPDANFKAALIADGVDTNNDGEIQVSEAESITIISVISENISSLEGISNFTNLEHLFCNINNLTSLDVSSLENLKQLNCRGNSLTTLNVANLSNLKVLIIGVNALPEVDLTGLSNLEFLNLTDNPITTLNLTGLSNLRELELCCSITLTSIIGINDLMNLTSLNCTFVNLGSLDISNLSNLEYLDCFNARLTSLILPIESSLEVLKCSQNRIPSLDLSNQSKLKEFHCGGSQLETLNLKNGIIEQVLHFPGNHNLRYICADADQIIEIQNLFNSSPNQYTNCPVNSFCTFIPGGEVFYIQGNVKLDLNTDGCDPSDINFPFLQLKATDTNGNSGIFNTNLSGDYDIALPEGEYTIEYLFPYASYFGITPPSFMVNFPTDTSPFVQDICLTPNGTYNDLQVTIIPVEGARPGFDADYKIVYANVGTTALSGNVTFTFEDANVDFVSASVAPDSQSTGQLSWSFSNLAPLDFVVIDVTMNLNTPTETPPLNGGDILCYEATIIPTTNDQTTSDNSFSLKQTVVNSFDPNDKTCLEGGVITPDLVGEYVHYLIRFENTGSASAVNIVVKDIIDTNKFEMSSFVPMTSSHEYLARVQNGNEVEFIFENIDLPFDDANNDGFIMFKIKTLPSLVVGDTFENNAEIYFDFNFPIITNTEQTFIENTASVDDVFALSNMRIFPNPANELLTIESSVSFDSVTIYDLKGRQLQTISTTTPQLTKQIDLSNFASGIYYVSVQSGTAKKLLKVIKE